MTPNSRSYITHFVQADTIIPESTQDTQAWDRYAFVNNNAVKYNDPTGHEGNSPDGQDDPSNLCEEHPDDLGCIDGSLTETEKTDLVSTLNEQASQEAQASATWTTVGNILLGVAIISAITATIILTGGIAGIALITGASVATVGAVAGGATAVAATAAYASNVAGNISTSHLANQTNINTAVMVLNNDKSGQVAVSNGKMYVPGSSGFSLPKSGENSIRSFLGALGSSIFSTPTPTPTPFQPSPISTSIFSY